MVGMDDRVETRGMTVTKENQVVGESRERERERKRGDWIEFEGAYSNHIYVCVCLYIYIFYMCSWKEEKREIGG